MAKYLIDGETLTDIATAIRGQTDRTGRIPVTQFAKLIRSIGNGGGGGGDVILAVPDNIFFESGVDGPYFYDMAIGYTFNLQDNDFDEPTHHEIYLNNELAHVEPYLIWSGDFVELAYVYNGRTPELNDRIFVRAVCKENDEVIAYSGNSTTFVWDGTSWNS
jgi:hypothetical protein